MPNGNEPIARDTGRAFGPFGRHLGHEVSMKERMQQLLSGIKSQIQYAPEKKGIPETKAQQRVGSRTYPGPR